MKLMPVMSRCYIYRSLVYLRITLRYSDPFGLVCSSPVEGQGIDVDKQWGRKARRVERRGET